MPTMDMVWGGIIGAVITLAVVGLWSPISKRIRQVAAVNNLQKQIKVYKTLPVDTPGTTLTSSHLRRLAP